MCFQRKQYVKTLVLGLDAQMVTKEGVPVDSCSTPGKPFVWFFVRRRLFNHLEAALQGMKEDHSVEDFKFRVHFRTRCITLQLHLSEEHSLKDLTTALERSIFALYLSDPSVYILQRRKLIKHLNRRSPDVHVSIHRKTIAFEGYDTYLDVIPCLTLL